MQRLSETDSAEDLRLLVEAIEEERHESQKETCGVNIYAGLDEASIDEKTHRASMVKNFDVLSQSKLLEKYNRYDLKQPKKDNTKAFSQSTCGLISLKELLAT